MNPVCFQTCIAQSSRIRLRLIGGPEGQSTTTFHKTKPFTTQNNTSDEEKGKTALLARDWTEHNSPATVQCRFLVLL